MGQSEQDRRVQLEEELRQERARSAQAKPLVDSSKLGQKPPAVFGNTEAGWADWSWRFRNHMAAANQGARIAMKFAEAAGATPVSEEQVKPRAGRCSPTSSTAAWWGSLRMRVLRSSGTPQKATA